MFPIKKISKFDKKFFSIFWPLGVANLATSGAHISGNTTKFKNRFGDGNCN